MGFSHWTSALLLGTGLVHASFLPKHYQQRQYEKRQLVAGVDPGVTVYLSDTATLEEVADELLVDFDCLSAANPSISVLNAGDSCTVPYSCCGSTCEGDFCNTRDQCQGQAASSAPAQASGSSTAVISTITTSVSTTGSESSNTPDAPGSSPSVVPTPSNTTPSGTPSAAPPPDTSSTVPPATSEIVPPASSSIVPADTSSIFTPDTSNIVPPASSSIVPADTSSVVPLDTSNIVPPGSASVVPPGTSSVPASVSAAPYCIPFQDPDHGITGYCQCSGGAAFSFTSGSNPCPYTSPGPASLSINTATISSSIGVVPSVSSLIPSGSATILTPGSASVIPSGTASLVPSRSGVIPPGSTSVVPSQSSVIPSGSTNVVPSGSSSAIPSNSASVVPSGSSVVPSGSASGVPARSSVIPSGSASVAPSKSNVGPSGSASVAPSKSNVGPSGSASVAPSKSNVGPSGSTSVVPSKSNVGPSRSSLTPTNSATVHSGSSIIPSSSTVAGLVTTTNSQGQTVISDSSGAVTIPTGITTADTVTLPDGSVVTLNPTSTPTSSPGGSSSTIPIGGIFPVTTSVPAPKATNGGTEIPCNLWFFDLCIQFGDLKIGGWLFNLPEGIRPPGPPPAITFPPSLSISVDISGTLPEWPSITIGPDRLPTYEQDPNDDPDDECETQSAEVCLTSTSFGVNAATVTTTSSVLSTCATVYGCDVSDSASSTIVASTAASSSGPYSWYCSAGCAACGAARRWLSPATPAPALSVPTTSTDKPADLFVRGNEVALTKRDIPNEAEADGINDFYSDVQGKSSTNLVPLDTTTNRGVEVGVSSSRFQYFDNSEFNIMVRDLMGCTSIVVVSRLGAYVSHFWEAPYFLGTDAEFNTGVTNYLASGRAGEAGTEPLAALAQAGVFGDVETTKIYIMTPAPRDEDLTDSTSSRARMASLTNGNQQPQYDGSSPPSANRLGPITTALNQYMPGVPIAQFVYSRATEGASSLLSSGAWGAAMILYSNDQKEDPTTFDPVGPPQQAIWQCWMQGTMMGSDMWDALPGQTGSCSAQGGNEKRQAGSLCSISPTASSPPNSTPGTGSNTPPGTTTSTSAPTSSTPGSSPNTASSITASASASAPYCVPYQNPDDGISGYCQCSGGAAFSFTSGNNPCPYTSPGPSSLAINPATVTGTVTTPTPSVVIPPITVQSTTSTPPSPSASLAAQCPIARGPVCQTSGGSPSISDCQGLVNPQVSTIPQLCAQPYGSGCQTVETNNGCALVLCQPDSLTEIQCLDPADVCVNYYIDTLVSTCGSNGRVGGYIEINSNLNIEFTKS